jgi:hypothetical protein
MRMRATSTPPHLLGRRSFRLTPQPAARGPCVPSPLAWCSRSRAAARGGKAKAGTPGAGAAGPGGRLLRWASTAWRCASTKPRCPARFPATSWPLSWAATETWRRRVAGVGCCGWAFAWLEDGGGHDKRGPPHPLCPEDANAAFHSAPQGGAPQGGAHSLPHTPFLKPPCTLRLLLAPLPFKGAGRHGAAGHAPRGQPHGRTAGGRAGRAQQGQWPTRAWGQHGKGARPSGDGRRALHHAASGRPGGLFRGGCPGWRRAKRPHQGGHTRPRRRGECRLYELSPTPSWWPGLGLGWVRWHPSSTGRDPKAGGASKKGRPGVMPGSMGDVLLYSHL